MDNHYHVALRSAPVPLTRSIGFVQSRFGQDSNRRHHSTGPLWQGRFKAEVVEDEGYPLQLIAYIHLNPVAAKVVADPPEYRRSGHRELLKKPPSPLVDTEQTLCLYGEMLRSARAAYVRTLERVDEATWRTCLPGALPWWGPERDRPLARGGGTLGQASRRAAADGEGVQRRV